MARIEPYVRVTEEIKSNPASSNLDNTANVGLVLVSDYGKKLDYVTGPSDFLQKYTADGVTVPRNAHISWYNAYFMSQFSALVISKAMNTTASKSLMYYSVQPNRVIVPNASPFLDANYVWYKDNHYLDTKLEWGFDLDNTADGAFAIVVNETVYYSGITEADLLAQYPDYANFNLFVQLSDIVWTSDTELEITSSISDLISELVSIISSFEDVTVESITPTYTVIESEGVYSVSTMTLDCVIYYTNDGIREDEAITVGYCGYSLVGWTSTEITYESDFNSIDTVSVDYSGLGGLTGASSIWALLYNNVLIYHGAYTELPADITDDVTATTDIYKISDNNQLNQIITRLTSSGIDIIDHSTTQWEAKKLEFSFLTTATEAAPIAAPKTYGNYEDAVVICAATITYSDLVDSTHLTEDVVARFSIYTDENSVTNFMTTTITGVDGSNFNLTYEDNDYPCSLDPDAVDISGVSTYIDYINTLNLGFKVEVMNQEFKSSFDLPTPNMAILAAYGSGLDRTESSKIVYLNAAASLLGDQDLYDISYLFDSGVTDVTFISRLSTIGIANKWFLPIDIPYNRTSVALIKNYFLSLALDSSNLIAVGPYDRNQSLTGWINLIAGSALYYQRLMANRANRNEFAPIFEQLYGNLTYADPVKNLTKTQREELLSFSRPINYVAYNQKNEVYYLNNNLTHQSVTNVLDEEHNRRLVNYIDRSARVLMRQFISKPNTQIVRDRVRSVLEKWLTDNIMIGDYKPDEFQVICSTTNNTEDDIRNHELNVTIKLRLQGSIKYITVLDEIYPIGVDFSM